jgi:hypothetical protein
LDTNKVNGAVEQLTQAIADSYKVLADRAVALQDPNVHLALDMMLNAPIEALHRQAESNRVMVQNSGRTIPQVDGSLSGPALGGGRRLHGFVLYTPFP